MLSKPSTYLQVDLNALLFNYHFFKSKIDNTTGIIAVVKAFAYGHESVAIAKELEKHQVAYFAVAYISEGITLRKAGITTPIIVFHPQLSDLHQCVKYNLEPSIYSFRLLNEIIQLSKIKNKKDFSIHLKFNTGMNRLGFSLQDISQIETLVLNKSYVKIISVFSHLVASEDAKEVEFTNTQIALFEIITSELKKKLPYRFKRHILNSSGIVNYPDAHFDLVRLGIGLYGYANDWKWTKQLKNVSTLHSVISQIHTIAIGESVGYNRSFKAKQRTKSATISLGYADGIPRSWGNGVGFVTINEQKANVIGNVCMDMFMIDVTNIDCKEGDVVLIFNTKENVEKMAARTNTISYELLTAISQRIPRLIVPVGCI